jgi:uncharacterized protein (TIGR02284 family)
MENTTKEKIQEILDILHDGNLGYQKLGTQFKDYDVSTVFLRLSQQRKMFIEELKYECLVQGEEVNASGTIPGFFHRMLLDIKKPFVDEEHIIDMAVRGEQEAVEVYNQHLTSDIPRFLKTKLEQQLGLIKGAIPQLQNFKSEMKSS